MRQTSRERRGRASSQSNGKGNRKGSAPADAKRAQELNNLREALQTCWSTVGRDFAQRREEAQGLIQRSESLHYSDGVRYGRLIVALADYYSTDYASSHELAEACYHEAKEAGDQVALGRALYILGMTARVTSTPSSAIPYYQEGLDVARAASDIPLEASLLQSLGYAIRADGRPEEALELFRSVRKLSEEHDLVVIRANILYAEGTVELDRGNFERARELIEEGRQLARENELDILVSSASQALGRILSEQGEVAAALKIELEILDIWEKRNYWHGVGLALCNSGFMAMTLGSYEQATDLLYRGLDLARTREMRDIEAIALQQISQLCEVVGDDAFAIEHYLKSMEIARTIDDRFTESVSAFYLARFYQRYGDMPRALAYYFRSLHLLRDIGRTSSDVVLLRAIGELYLDVNDRARAAEYLHESLQCAEQQHSSPEIANTMIPLGRLRFLSGEKEEGRKMIEEGIELARKGEGYESQKNGITELARIAAELKDESLAHRASLLMQNLLTETFDSESAHRVSSLLRQHSISHLRHEAERLELREEEISRIEELSHLWAEQEDRRRKRKVFGEENSSFAPAAGTISDEVEAEIPPRYRITTFGQFSVDVDGITKGPTDWKRKKSRDLFKLLLINHRNVVTVSEIEELLWGKRVEKIEQLVMVAASHIRSALGLTADRSELSLPSLTFQENGYRLDLGNQTWIDFIEFKKLIVTARRARTATERLQIYEESLNIGSGEFLPTLRYAEWTAFHRRMLEDAWFEAEEYVAREYLRRGNHEKGIEEARKILSLDLTNECGWDVLLRSLVASGRHETARRELERCREAYRERLDEEPPEMLSALL